MNHLAGETSPYLRQHRDNPVDWYPWGEEAFNLARERDVPVFLSVGYSSCHWCHVMAHESFADESVAQVMNTLFVNVKVDREERPDVDGVYMQAVQAMSGRGGWPMSVWLTPDGRPFYGGTYFPPDDRHGTPAFVRVCEAIAHAWRERRDELLTQADRLTQSIDEAIFSETRTHALDRDVLAAALAGIRAQFEPHHGGFGRAPKFPQAMTIDHLCRAYVRDESPDTLAMVTTTLDAMAAGGICDHIGGGFSRYSTDDYWLVPHFEKMLYDNALLLRAYLHAYLITARPKYRRVVEETITYVLRDLRGTDGGYASAEDADSEGVEGKFYLWSAAEIAEVCGDDTPEFVRYFGVTENGNFVEPHTGHRGNILHAVDRDEEPPIPVQRARTRLFERRASRVRPGLDDKVLLEWNALFLAALTEAAAALDRVDWLEAARTNARFLLSELRRDDGRWLRSWQRDAPSLPGIGRARHLAYAEDYAALLEAFVTLAEVDDHSWLSVAIDVADSLIELFHDERDGGFFRTGHDAETLIVRQKDVFDNATPSANSLAANGLLRLWALTGDPRYEAPALGILRNLAPAMAQHPTAFAYLLGASERHLDSAIEIVVIGDPADRRTAVLRREVFGRLIPSSVALSATSGDVGASPLLQSRTTIDGAPAAYVCEHNTCRLPVTDPEALRAEIDRALSGRLG